jgi:SSS family solute:Na+ symporter
MSIRLAIVLAYLAVMLLLGLIFRKVSSKNKAEFFLAGRKVPRALLFCTMAATNFSAFTIFGLSGAGYRIGYAFLPIMGFGTGFMAIAFLTFGKRINSLSRARGYITPADCIADRYGSPFLSRLFSVVMIVFTLPYVAIQAVSSGKSLESLVGLPYWCGALLVTGASVIYVIMGGMRSDIWTDVIQAVMMIGLTLAAFIVIAVKSGGFAAVNNAVFTETPALFSRPGADGSLTPGVWLGYMLLWLFADPMFPQLFQRFMAAKDGRALNTAAVLYPLVTTFLFFLTVSIGVMGRAALPGLSAAESDSIFPLLLEHFVGGPFAVLLLLGGMAALMSTLDSQLLSLGSMIGLDFVRKRTPGVMVEKLIVLLAAAVGFLIALNPPKTLLDFINKTSFYGFAALAPTAIGAVYWKRGTKYGAIASIVLGEAAVAASYFNILVVPGVLPAVPVIAVSLLSYVIVSLLTPSRGENPGIAAPVSRRAAPWVVLFLALFVLGNDFWAWGRSPVLVFGLPLWVLYSMGLGIALSAAFALYARRTDGIRRPMKPISE